MASEYKRISTKRGTRYVKVLSSGKYKFIKKSLYDQMTKKKSKTKKPGTRTKNPGRRKKTMAKKKKKGRKGTRIFGNIGIKGLVIGSGLLAALKYLIRTRFPQAGAYTTSISAIGAGATARVLGSSGKSLVTYGAVDGLSELITDLILPGGMVNAFGTPQTTRGYDYG